MRRLISLAVSAALLAMIYWQIDARHLAEVIAGVDPGWLTVGLGMVVPLTVLSALRLALLTPPGILGIGKAIRLTLLASTLNMVLPSKLGDIAKACGVMERGRIGGAQALALVVFEKGWDMAGLLTWCVLALLVAPGKGPGLWAVLALVSALLAVCVAVLCSPWAARAMTEVVVRFGRLAARATSLSTAWSELLGRFWGRPGRAAALVVLSIFIWFLHLLQIWLFILALQAYAPFLASLFLAPLALLAGLLPLTFAGVGTRDAALVLLYQPYFSTPTAVALGILCTLRYLLPAVAGLPFIGGFLDAVRRFQAEAQ
jgi:glycosyltransferase 2 family protein